MFSSINLSSPKYRKGLSDIKDVPSIWLNPIRKYTSKSSLKFRISFALSIKLKILEI